VHLPSQCQYRHALHTDFFRDLQPILESHHQRGRNPFNLGLLNGQQLLHKQNRTVHSNHLLHRSNLREHRPDNILRQFRFNLCGDTCPFHSSPQTKIAQAEILGDSGLGQRGVGRILEPCGAGSRRLRENAARS